MPPIGSLGQNNNNNTAIHKSAGVTKPQQNNKDKNLLRIISTLSTQNTILETHA